MRQHYCRFAPYVVAGLLVLNLIRAGTDPTRGHWLWVGILALTLALILWSRGRTEDTADSPETRGPPRAGS